MTDSQLAVLLGRTKNNLEKTVGKNELK